MTFDDIYKLINSSSRYMPPTIHSPHLDQLNASYSIQSTVQSQEYLSRIHHRDLSYRVALAELDHQIANLAAEEELLSGRLDSSKRSLAETWYAIVAVVWISLTGILVPLVMMPADTNQPISDLQRYAVILLFVSGLAAFILLICVQLWKLKR